MSALILKTIAILLIGVLISILIAAKANKQFVDLLEGAGFNRRTAKALYDKHKQPKALLLFISGIELMAVSMMAYGKYGGLVLISGILGLVLLSLGIASRVRSFRLAESDLRTTIGG